MNKNFLSKKSFHTKTKKNLEQVWKKEEEKKAEEKKISELRKQIEEERNMEDLKKLQREYGGASKEEKVEWVYQAPLSSATNSTDDYLLGKPIKALGGDGNNQETDKQQMSKLGLDYSKTISVQQDLWQKLQEDPLFEIKRRQKEALDNIKKNPLKMRKLKEEKEKKSKKSKKEKKEKKEKKKKKHSEYKEKNIDSRRDDNHDRDKERGDGHDDRRSERHDDRNKHMERDRERKYGRSRSRDRENKRDERSRSREREGRNREENEKGDRRRNERNEERKYRRSRSSERDRKENRRDRRSRSREDRDRRDRDRSTENRREKRSRSRDSHKYKESMENNSGLSYGLSFPNGAPPKKENTQQVRRSPSPEEETNKNFSHQKTRKRRLTEKEMEEKRRMMEQDAQDLNSLRDKRIQQSLVKEKLEEENHHQIKNETPKFIQDTNKSAYLGSEESMAERLKRNVFFREKN